MFKINRFYIKIILLLLCSVTASYSSLVVACEKAVSPRDLLQSLSHEMINAINENYDAIKSDESVTRKLVEDVLLPHTNFTHAARNALRFQWDKLSSDQRKNFRDEFQLLLVRVSSTLLGNYIMEKEDKLDFSIMSFDNNYNQMGRLAIVGSTINTDASRKHKVRYKLRCFSDSWKIVEVRIDGSPFIQTYSKNFESMIRKDGFSGLMAYLRNKNAELLVSATD